MSICKWTDDKIMVQLMSLKCQCNESDATDDKIMVQLMSLTKVSICKWTDDKIMVQLMSLKCQYVSEQMTK